jgi:hypothetical protein
MREPSHDLMSAPCWRERSWWRNRAARQCMSATALLAYARWRRGYAAAVGNANGAKIIELRHESARRVNRRSDAGIEALVIDSGGVLAC